MVDSIFVNFMPWLTIYQDITLGEITFWNYSREAENRINDSKVKERLDRHFKSYKNNNGSSNSITICSFEGKTFYDKLNEREFGYLREAITALSFGSTIERIEKRVQEKQRNTYPPSMTSFDLISRQLEIGSDYYTHLSLSHMDLGLSDEYFTFQKPLGIRDECYVCSKWRKYLTAYLNLEGSNKLRNRISRSLEFVRLAETQDDLKDNSQETAFLTWVVLLSTAFESLLNFPIFGKADFFADYINRRFSLPNSRKSSRTIRKNKPKIQYSLVAWWAYDFYKLRNSIVHGNRVNFEKLRFKQGLWFSQMEVACLVFADCLEDLIRTKRIIKGKKSKVGQLFIDHMEVEDIFLSRGQINWEKHHKVLEWIR